MGITDAKWIEARDAAKHPICTEQLSTEFFLVQNVSSVIEKCCCKMIVFQ